MKEGIGDDGAETEWAGGPRGPGGMSDEATAPNSSEFLGRLTSLVWLVGLGYLVFATFRPFFSAVIWSAVLSYGLYPVYGRLARATGERRSMSAVVMSLGVTLGVILPLAYVSFLIGKEVAKTYLSLVSSLEQGPGVIEQWLGHPWVAAFADQLQEFQRLTGTDLRSVLVDNLAQLGSTLVEQLTHVARNILAGLTELGIILLTTFYLFRDGERVIGWLKQLLPLTEARQQLVVRRFDEVIKAAIFGNTLVAALEGIVGGLAFALAGVPAPLLWGATMAVLAYLPLVGAAIVWGPVALYLFIQGRYGAVVILCVAGMLIAILDYVVRNIVVGGASKMHTLLAFFAMLGGLQFFGLVGIVMGPLVVAISMALLESYRTRAADLVVSHESR